MMKSKLFNIIATIFLIVISIISVGAVADQETQTVPAIISQVDSRYAIISASNVPAFPYGQSSMGQFHVMGNINLNTEHNGITAFGIESGILTFSYAYNGYNLQESDTAWSVVDDSSKEIDGIKLDASIQKGALLVQKSYDGKTWINAAPPQVNYFATVSKGDNCFYTASGEDLARGTYYRVILAYKMHKKSGTQGIFNAPTYKEAFCLENYSFYACINTANISLHNLIVDEKNLQIGHSNYETGDWNFKLNDAKQVSNMSFGLSGISSVNITGQINQEKKENSFTVVNVAGGDLSVNVSISQRLLTSKETSWSFMNTNVTKVNGTKLPSKMGKGVLLFQFSRDKKVYANVMNPICNLLVDYPDGLTLSHKTLQAGYYRIIVAYQTRHDTFPVYNETYHMEVYLFQVTKDSIESAAEIEDGYSLTALEKGETLTDGATTVKGFKVDKLGTSYEVMVNGTAALDGQCFTKNGRYDIVITTPLGNTKTLTVYVFHDKETNGASTYFADIPVSGNRIFCDGDLPTYDNQSAIHLLKVDESVPALTGTITNTVTGEEIVLDGSSREERTVDLAPGTYCVDLYSGQIDAGSVYHYEMNFNVVDEKSQPCVNYNNLMSADRLSDLSSKYYQVNYQTTRGGYISVCFADYQHAFNYAYEIEKRFIEDGRYKSADNPNIKVKYAESNEGLIELTQAVNRYAEQNVEVAFFDPTDEFTYRTLEDSEQLSNLEALSLPDSVKVIPSEEEKALLYLRQPFLNGFTFIQAADYDVVNVKALCLVNNTVYPIKFGTPVEEQLSVSSEYLITETNKYGDTRSYSAYFASANQTKIAWKTVSSNENSATTEWSTENGEDFTASLAQISSAENTVDSGAIVTIIPDGAYSYSLTCLVSDLPGLILTEAGNYTFVFVDRIGNMFRQVVHITGGAKVASIERDAFTYSELYNKVYLHDKAVIAR